MNNVFQNIEECIGETPVIQLKTPFLPSHKKLFLKLEFFNPTFSIKDRTALGLVKDAFVRGQLKLGGTIIESTSGNLGKSLAMLGASMGFKVILVIDPKAPQTYAACQLLFILAPAKTENLMINLNASLATSSFAQLSIYAWLLIVAIILVICLISKNYLFSLGADVAKSLGLNTDLLLFLLLGLILLISTISVVLVGPLLFFPLLAVQISRLLISRHRPYLFLLVNLLIGAALLLGADMMLRLIYQDWEAPLNIFIAVLGVPVLIYHSKSLR